MIRINGSTGEGGGQVLRTALSLSSLTGQKFEIYKIRGGRKKPGLLRQHLTCVKAAAQISGAKTTGAELKSSRLIFEPQVLQAGTYEFSIGSAGSCVLVLQTVLPILMNLSEPSTLILKGGTHNPMAPPIPFLKECFLPVLKRMGVGVEIEERVCGFYPAGGGEIEVKIYPCKKLLAQHISERGELLKQGAQILSANLPVHVAKREFETLDTLLNWRLHPQDVISKVESPGPGNLVSIHAIFENISASFCSFGIQGVKAEKVASLAVKQYKEYIAQDCPVELHLADQLMVPFALAGSGSFTTTRLSLHSKTNLEIIGKFLNLPIEVLEESEDRIRVVFG